MPSILTKVLLSQIVGVAQVASQYSAAAAGGLGVPPAGGPYEACVEMLQSVGRRGTVYDKSPRALSVRSSEDTAGCFTRTMDGMANNLEIPTMGAANQVQQRLAPFSPGQQAAGGAPAAPVFEAAGGAGVGGAAAAGGSVGQQQQPSPRAVSSAVLREVGSNLDPMLSSFAWAWLQFIDHDITLVRDDRGSCG